ncbi:MAG: DnaA ATPase domain-containing protein [Phycisphaerales bacterium JB039]
MPTTPRTLENGSPSRARLAERSAPQRVSAPSLRRLVRDRISEAVGETSFERYFARAVDIRVEDDSLELAAPSQFLAQFLDRRFGDVIRGAMRADATLAERGGRIRFTVNRRTTPVSTASPAAPTTPAASPPAPAVGAANGQNNGNGAATAPRPRLRARKRADAAPMRKLDDMVVGPANELAYTAACRLAEAGAEPEFSLLFVHGACGVGKTHLLQGLARRFQEQSPGAKVKYLTGEAFTNEFVTAIRSDNTESFRKAYRNVDLLCIDDVHFLTSKQATQKEFLHTLDTINLDGARLALASDEHPARVDAFNASLASRFLAGLVAEIEAPTLPMRIEYLRRESRRRDLKLADDALRLIAESPEAEGRDSSFRDLGGALTRVEALHRLVGRQNGSEVGLLTVRRALGMSDPGVRTTGGRDARRPIRLERILDVVCAELEVEQTDLFGRGRHKKVVLARALITLLARRLTTRSYPEIARGIGRPNHSTVITAHQRIERQMADGMTVEVGSGVDGLSIEDLAARLERRIRTNPA